MNVRRPSTPVLVAVLALAISTAVPVGTSGAIAGGWEQKVASRVLVDTAGRKSASFIVILASQADVGNAASIPSKLAKGRFVFDTLRAHAAKMNMTRCICVTCVLSLTSRTGDAQIDRLGARCLRSC